MKYGVFGEKPPAPFEMGCAPNDWGRQFWAGGRNSGGAGWKIREMGCVPNGAGRPFFEMGRNPFGPGRAASGKGCAPKET